MPTCGGHEPDREENSVPGGRAKGHITFDPPRLENFTGGSVEAGEIRHRRGDEATWPSPSTVALAALAEQAQAECVEFDEALGVLLVVGVGIVFERDHFV
jgi:hypothetical protein